MLSPSTLTYNLLHQSPQMTVEAKSLVEKFFTKNSGVKFVRLQWVDFSGALLTRFITKIRCMHLAMGTNHYSLAQNCMIVPISTAPQCFYDGPKAWELCPDWQTVKVCGFAPEHASVMCFNSHLGSADHSARCPRKLLSKVLNDFKDEYESNLLMVFEIEFVLLDESSNLAKSMDRLTGYSMTAGLRAENLTIMEEIVAALEVSGIKIYHFLTEVADQLEIALSPLPPMQAIDALMLAQETIRTICIRHKLRATMTPKPCFNGPQNGCHVHLSLNPATQPSSFLAGILQKLKPLCAFGMPNFDSYYRVVGDGSGMWIGWGTENRDLPIRQISPNRWEIRCLDATANMYLFTAATLSAGIAGIKQTLPLNIRDCPVLPSEYTTKEAAERLGKYGITEPVPSKLELSLESAKCDKE